jgi:hypothetical protein
MNATPMNPTALWYADGMRWIGDLVHGATERLESPVATPEAFPPLDHDEYLAAMRHRIVSHF